MKSRLIAVTTVAALSFLVAVAAAAAVPPVLNFSGRLGTDAGDFTGAANITGTIYDGPASQPLSLALWTETQDLFVDQGRFHMFLGDDPSNPLPDELWMNPELFLGISVNGDDEMQPRVRLVSVPFALRSTDSQMLGGLESDAFSPADHGHELTTLIGTLGESQLPDTVVLDSELASDLAGKSDIGHLHDDTYVNEGQAGSIDGAMVLDRSLTLVDLGDSGCGDQQIARWDEAAQGWICGDDKDTEYSPGTGLTLTGTEFSVDQAQVEGWAQAVCYDEPAELYGVLGGVYSALNHIHDGRYYTETEMDALLLSYAPAIHAHDDLYYGKGAVDTALAGKSDTGHLHDDRYYTETEIAAMNLVGLDPVGCADGQVIKWDVGTGDWFCDDDASGTGGDGNDRVKADAADPTAGYLSGKVDGASLEVDTTGHVLRVKDGGILLGHLGPGSVDGGKILDRSVLKEDLGDSGCGDGQVLKWNATTLAWECGSDDGGTSYSAGVGLELDGGVFSAPNSPDWDTAYGWGDHATAGYLTSYTETDPVFQTSAAYGIEGSDIANWDTAYGWGDHSAAGYLTSYTETDPQVGSNTQNYLSRWSGSALVTGSVYDDGVAIGIGTTDVLTHRLNVNGTIAATGGNSTQWNTAHGWGDHSTAGYLTTYSETDPQVGANTTGYLPRWNGTALTSGAIYDNGTNVGIGTSNVASYRLNVNGHLNASGDISASGGNSTQWNTAVADAIKWDGGATGLNAATGRASLGLGSLATLSAVSGGTGGTITDGTIAFADLGANGCTDGNVMRFDGSDWACATLTLSDADTLDTLDSTQFLRSDTSDTMTGTLTIEPTGSSEGLRVDSTGSGTSVYALQTGTGAGGAFQIMNASNSQPALSGMSNGTNTAIYGSNTGTGRAGFFQVMNSLNGTEALVATSNGSGNSFKAEAVGTGHAGYFLVDNASSTKDAVLGSSNGSGNAIHGVMSGTGIAGNFQTISASNTDPAIQATHTGLGSVAYLAALNASNPAATLMVQSSGTGHAAHFVATSASNPAHVLKVDNYGTGTGGYFMNSSFSSTGDALYAMSLGSGSAVSGTNNGTGHAGFFQIANGASSANAVNAQTSGAGDAVKAYSTGTGRTGFFQVDNVLSTADVLHVTGNGYGTTLLAESTGTGVTIKGSSASGNAGYFEVTGTNANQDALVGKMDGKARAGHLFINNFDNTTDALLVETIGEGGAGKFAIVQSANASVALTASTIGTGQAALFSSSSGSRDDNVVEITGAGSPNLSQALLRVDAGSTLAWAADFDGKVQADVFSASVDDTSNSAGIFEINEASNANDALVITNSGTGNGVYSQSKGTGAAGYFHVSNPGSSSPALHAKTEGTGNAGYFEGTVMATEDIATQSEFAYSASRTYYRTLAPSEFMPAQNSYSTFPLISDGYRYASNTNQQIALAPVHLPQGANMKSVSCYINDEDAVFDIGTANFYLLSRNRSTIMSNILANASGSTTGSSQKIVTMEDDTVWQGDFGNPVDNENYFYRVSFYFDLPPGSTCGQNCRFYGCRIEYELDTVSFP